MGKYTIPTLDLNCSNYPNRFVLQLISLAGLHTNATITTELSRAFKDEGMLAYVRLVQSREKEMGVDVLTHQKWSGAPYIDGILGAIQSGNSSSKSMGEGNTEKGEFLLSGSFDWGEVC
jgi:isocitrate lyase